MATLSGQTIANTFDSILHVEDDTAGLVATSTDSRVIQDGVGANSALALATDSVRITSTNKLYFNDVGGEYISGNTSILSIVGGSEIDLASTAIDINASAGVTIDGTTISIDGTDDSNLTVAGSGKDLSIVVSGGGTQTLTMSSAGTGTDAIGLTASAGGITVGLGGDAGDDFNVDSNTFVVESDNNRVGIGIAAPTALLHTDQATGWGSATPPGIGIQVTAGNAAICLYDDNAGSSDVWGISQDSGHFYISSTAYASNDWGYDGRTNRFIIQSDGDIIVPSGNLGVGTHTPGALLEILNSTTSSTTQGGKLRLTADDGQVLADTHRLGILEFAGAGDTGGTTHVGAAICAFANQAFTSAGTPDFGTVMEFWTADDTDSTLAVRMHISQTGKVGIGETDPDTLLHITGTGDPSLVAQIEATTLTDTDNAVFRVLGTRSGGAQAQTDIGVTYENGSDTDNPTSYIRLEASDGVASYLFSSDNDKLHMTTTYADIGKESGTAMVGEQSSDERLKNISSDAFPYGLLEVNAMTPIKFTYKDVKVPTNTLGFGAQTIQNIIPESVKQTNDCLDGYDTLVDEDTGKETYTPKSNNNKMMMQYHQLIPVLVKAVQELSAKVEALENA